MARHLEDLSQGAGNSEFIHQHLSESENQAALRERIGSASQALQQALTEYTITTRSNPNFILGDHTAPTSIDQSKINWCRVLSRREDIIRLMPKSGKALEIGTQTGLFAKFILDTLEGLSLTTIDITYDLFDYEQLNPYIKAGRLQTVLGDSARETALLADDSLDFIYLDASHAYEHVKADLAAAHAKVKIGGYIVCNDYTCWSPFEGSPYGVVQAVNEFLGQHEFEVSYFAFHPYGYNDIALRRIG